MVHILGTSGKHAGIARQWQTCDLACKSYVQQIQPHDWTYLSVCCSIFTEIVLYLLHASRTVCVLQHVNRLFKASGSQLKQELDLCMPLKGAWNLNPVASCISRRSRPARRAFVCLRVVRVCARARVPSLFCYHRSTTLVGPRTCEQF